MRPEQPPTFDPNEERYWDKGDLGSELQRVFSICHGCRMCVGYCPSFPAMFKAVDAYVEGGEGEIEVFKIADYEEVNDLCYQCKLCYIKCPYTPDDGHDFALDFPRLMLRQKAQRARVLADHLNSPMERLPLIVREVWRLLLAGSDPH